MKLRKERTFQQLQVVPIGIDDRVVVGPEVVRKTHRLPAGEDGMNGCQRKQPRERANARIACCLGPQRFSWALHSNESATANATQSDSLELYA
jgi:hypothetical protein